MATSGMALDDIARSAARPVAEVRGRLADTADREAAPVRAPATAATTPRAWLAWSALAVMLALLGAGSALLLAGRIEKLYAARAEVLLYLGDRDGETVQRFLATQRIVLTGPTLLAPVATALGMPLEALQRRVTVEAVNASAVLRVELADPQSERALAGVRDITTRYLARLRAIEAAERTGHELLTPPYALAEAVWPKPLQAAALGGAAGLLVAGLAFGLRLVAAARR